MFANKKREGINTLACAVSLYVAETREATIKDNEPQLPLITFDIVAYGFVGQRFLKQLYKSCTFIHAFASAAFIIISRARAPSGVIMSSQHHYQFCF